MGCLSLGKIWVRFNHYPSYFSDKPSKPHMKIPIIPIPSALTLSDSSTNDTNVSPVFLVIVPLVYCMSLKLFQSKLKILYTATS